MTVNLSIRGLTEIIGGKLQLGSTPPLGGEYEPIGRLVPAGDKLRKGDVVVSQHEVQDAQSVQMDPLSEYCAEESFMGGALGVISARDICPWHGCFSIQVNDLEAAMWQYLERTKDRVAGTTLAVFDERTISPIITQLKQHGIVANTTWRLAWQCLSWQDPEVDRLHVVQVRTRDEFQMAQHFLIGTRDIAIITDHADEDLVAMMQTEEMQGNANVLRNGHDEVLADLLLTKIKARQIA